MGNKKYLGKRKEAYNKRNIIDTSNQNIKTIFSSGNSINKKKSNLQNILSQPQFREFLEDVKSRVQKLNREYAIQQANYSNNEIPEEIGKLSNALNDYTNNLVGFYEKSYFHIQNESERKRFIRDLKMIIGTYGKLEENLHNIVYNGKLE